MTLPTLTRDPLSLPPAPPERVLQFGEGVFLRGFIDWMVDVMNERGLFNGGVAVVKPRGGKSIETFNDQQGLYTLLTRGLRDGKRVDEVRVVQCISRGIDPTTQWDALLKIARDPNIRFVVSNTTEAGIARDDADQPDARPPKSFPAKLTRLLLERWRAFEGDAQRGWIILPCELIEENGATLRRLVLETAREWNLDAVFIQWIGEACVFCNTLVDRIVSGKPADSAAIDARLGYRDELLNTAEPYHALVIEAPAFVADELPLRQAGLNVIWTADAAPFRRRKVRLLNGAHMVLVPASFLAGHDLVREAMDDPTLRDFVRSALAEEILPTLNQPIAELEAFKDSVLERFANPFVDHRLLAIAMNSTSKFKVRLLGVLQEYFADRGHLPRRIVFALAALIAYGNGSLLRPHEVQDDAAAISAMRAAWELGDLQGTVEAILKNTQIWEQDLTTIPGLLDAVTDDLQAICQLGVIAAIKRLEK